MLITDHPMYKKATLGIQIVNQLYNLDTALKAAERWRSVFQKKEVPEDEFKPLNSRILIDAIVELGAFSKTQARQMLKSGAVRLDGEKLGESLDVPIQVGQKLQVGKHLFGKIV
jgi:tyrosyl-tRNA synthetase